MSDDDVLALLNTTPTLDGVRSDRLRTDPEVADDVRHAWGGAGGRAELDALALARDAVQRAVVEGLTDGTLDEVLGGTCRRPVLTPEGLSWQLESASDHASAMRFLMAWTDLQQRLPGRLRSCDNEECSLFLLDRSKGNRGRWCSMTTCGNRMKARRHQQRAREQHQT